MVRGGSWQFLTAQVSLSQFLIVLDIPCQSLTVLRGDWWSLVVFGGYWCYVGGSSWSVVAPGVCAWLRAPFLWYVVVTGGPAQLLAFCWWLLADSVGADSLLRVELAGGWLVVVLRV